MLDSGWRKGPGKVRLAVADALRRRGYAGQFAELHVVGGLWNADATTETGLTWTARLLAQAALVGCLPVIRTAAGARAGVSLSAVAVDASGRRLGAADGRLHAEINGRRSRR